MKNLGKFCSIFILTHAISAHVNAASLDADINNEAIRAQYNISDKNAELGLSVGAMLTDDKGEVAYLTARTQGSLANQSQIRGGFGGRAYYASPEDGDDFQSLAIGGFLDITVPQLTDLTIGVDVFYAPSITTTDDIDNLREISFRASYQLFENASAYIGVRHLEIEDGDFEYEFDEGAHIGFTLQF